MKRPLILAIALATLTANAAFAAPRVESIALRGAQQLIASDGSDRTLERLRKTQAPRVQEERRVAESGSEQTIDRLHRDMTSREARLAENGSEQTVDRLHKDMGRVDLRLADNGSERTVDRLHREMRAPPDTGDNAARCEKSPARCRAFLSPRRCGVPWGGRITPRRYRRYAAVGAAARDGIGLSAGGRVAPG